MNVELLELLELDDLQGEARELAECIGMDAFRRLLERYGGTGKMYIPQPDKVVIPVRDVLIRAGAQVEAERRICTANRQG